jgi:hypothetical protein
MADDVKKKNPFAAAMLNFFLNGLGYVYNGNRVLFGTLLIFCELGMLAIYYNDFLKFSAGIIFKPFYVMVLMSVAFAVDGYNEARRG